MTEVTSLRSLKLMKKNFIGFVLSINMLICSAAAAVGFVDLDDLMSSSVKSGMHLSTKGIIVDYAEGRDGSILGILRSESGNSQIRIFLDGKAKCGHTDEMRVIIKQNAGTRTLMNVMGTTGIYHNESEILLDDLGVSRR